MNQSECRRRTSAKSWSREYERRGRVSECRAAPRSPRAAVSGLARIEDDEQYSCERRLRQLQSRWCQRPENTQACSGAVLDRTGMVGGGRSRSGRHAKVAPIRRKLVGESRGAKPPHTRFEHVVVPVLLPTRCLALAPVDRPATRSRSNGSGLSGLPELPKVLRPGGTGAQPARNDETCGAYPFECERVVHSYGQIDRNRVHIEIEASHRQTPEPRNLQVSADRLALPERRTFERKSTEELLPARIDG